MTVMAGAFLGTAAAEENWPEAWEAVAAAWAKALLFSEAEWVAAELAEEGTSWSATTWVKIEQQLGAWPAGWPR